MKYTKPGYTAGSAVQPPASSGRKRRSPEIGVLKAHELLKASQDNLSVSERQNQFESTYKTWLAEQNLRFETHGVWSEALRAW